MIITRTPYRISFFGGGSDLEDFYSKSPGAVLSVGINKYMYITSHGFFHPDRIQVKYSVTENVGTLAELAHPIVREILQKFEISGGIEISSIADIPAGTGLGSSSSFTVGILHNMYVQQGKYATKDELAEAACDIEINRLREPIGKQDQYAAAFGGLNIFRFLSSGRVTTEQIYLNKNSSEEFLGHLMLFYTGRQRSASKILQEQKTNMQKQDKISVLKEMVAMVDPGRDALYAGNYTEFGKILHAGWLLKKQLAVKISDDDIDVMYDRALQNGAIGGKLLGAGGGGFMLFCCSPQDRERLRSALPEFKEVPLNFDYEGTKVIYVGDAS